MNSYVTNQYNTFFLNYKCKNTALSRAQQGVFYDTYGKETAYKLQTLGITRRASANA